MSTITKQWLQQKIAAMEATRDEIPFGLDEGDSNTLAAMKLALASLEAEAVGEVVLGEYDDCGCHPDAKVVCIAADGQADWENFKDGTRLYAAPPAPVSVPDLTALDNLAGEMLNHAMNCERRVAVAYTHCAHRLAEEVRDLRAAMLQGADGNSPVIPDDVRRMDWLVSKTVDVREPMVYGSHSLFWSQTITDEEDDYHATKLREQIDAAMAAEQAAAPQQEVK